tara:strand:- start:29 stop:595 length:567 start_codon:yes stop_codon:yes gene_type:complete
MKNIYLGKLGLFLILILALQMPVIETFIEGNTIPNAQKSAIAIKAAIKSESDDENTSTSYGGKGGLYNKSKFGTDEDVDQSYYNKTSNDDSTNEDDDDDDVNTNEKQRQTIIQEPVQEGGEEADTDNSSWWKSSARWIWIIGIIIICLVFAYIVFSKRIRVNVRVFNNSAKKAGKALRAGSRKLMNLF